MRYTLLITRVTLLYCLTALGKLEGFIKQQKTLDFYRNVDAAMIVKSQYPVYIYHIPYVFHQYIHCQGSVGIVCNWECVMMNVVNTVAIVFGSETLDLFIMFTTQSA